MFAITKNKLRLFSYRGLLLYDAVIVFLLSVDFYSRWLPSSKIAVLAKMAHLSVNGFLVCGSLILAVLGISIVDAMLHSLGLAFNRIKSRELSERFRKVIPIILVFCLQYLSLEYSLLSLGERILQQGILSFFTNVGMVCSFNLLLLLLCGKWKPTLIVSSVFFAVWGIANYYTILFHGSPLFLSELVNIRTAAGVALNYRYRFTETVAVVLSLLAANLYTVLNTATFSAPRLSKRKQILAGLGISILITFFGYQITEKKNESWLPWDTTIERCGFFACTIDDLNKKLNPITTPEGYDSAGLPTTAMLTDKYDSEKPDIILILNESFCDLSQYTETDTDVDCLQEFYSIEGAEYGYAIASSVGGGTNNSEFELLTSKSMYLLRNSAPFTYLSSEQLKGSVVEYLKNLGYSTTAMHCGGERNYKRHIAYPALGFDSIFLGPEHFLYLNYNGNRPWLDSDNYRDLMDHFGETNERPQFFYLLTLQNHGGYEQNDAQLDTVHLQNNFGSLTDDLDEYLSSIQLSAKAFRELTEKLSAADRHVIVCMVGDHAPSFINDLPPKEDLTLQQKEISKRLVPYVIWTNYNASLPENTDYVTMTDLVPMILESAGLPLSTFYQYVLDLHDILPVRTSNGIYMNQDSEIGLYEKGSPYYDMMNQYYYMEYNSLILGDDYREDLFLPQVYQIE